MPPKAKARSAGTKDSTATIRGIEDDIGKEHAQTFSSFQPPDLRADYVLTNPPFNDSDTALRGNASPKGEAKPQVVSEAKDNFRNDDDVRWQWSGATWTTRQVCPQGERGGVHQFGVPPKGNANFAWMPHFIHHLAPQGMAGFVLANGSMEQLSNSF